MATWLNSLSGKISPAALESAKAEAAKGTDPAIYLLSRKLMAPRALLSALSRYHRLPYVELERYHPDEETMLLVPEDVARRFTVFPLFHLKDRLYVAIPNSDDMMALDYLRQLTSMSVAPVLALRSEVEAALNRHYRTSERFAKAMGEIVEADKAERLDQEETMVEMEDLEAPAIRLANYIITHAINLGASDIHLERSRKEVYLRYRVDGVLHDFSPPPLRLYNALTARVKILSNLDVSERRQPQDGRASFQLRGHSYDLRISVMPQLHGEGVVIRILDPQGLRLELDDLGFPPDTLERYKRLVRKPHGILLVTGPTGSGKTTTLYSTLLHIQSREKKIVTIEDPVEYELPGISQIQVHADIGFDFARAMRSILRQDPDIVMLGEIRDLESAEIAIRASLTGHLVFSTLHTNDAPSAMTRLFDMGVAPYLVLASLQGVLAQRLVRRLCPECKEPVELSPAQIASIRVSRIPESSRVFRSVGCAACGNLGYRGRIGVFELLEITPAMRRLTPDQLNPEELREMAAKNSFTTLRESALEKFFSGLTSIEEVLSLPTAD